MLRYVMPQGRLTPRSMSLLLFMLLLLLFGGDEYVFIAGSKVRLVDGDSQESGRVEIFLKVRCFCLRIYSLIFNTYL